VSSSSNSAGSGIGVLGVLGIVFVTLKLTHHIDWSWLWVTAPFWGPFALVLAAIIAYLAVTAVGSVTKPRGRR
jgi:hypothetical protein